MAWRGESAAREWILNPGKCQVPGKCGQRGFAVSRKSKEGGVLGAEWPEVRSVSCGRGVIIETLLQGSSTPRLWTCMVRGL